MGIDDMAACGSLLPRQIVGEWYVRLAMQARKHWYFTTMLCLIAMAILPLEMRFATAGTTAVVKLPYHTATESLIWHDAKRNRNIPVKIYAPALGNTSGKLPVVVFSHGYGEDRDSYNYLGQYWAAHGYIAVFLTHHGSDRETQQKKGLPRGDTAHGFDPRPLDISFVADMLTSASNGSSLLDGRVDSDNLAVAGQCAGSTAALYMTGLRLESTDGTIRQSRDPRFKAVIALGPQMPIRIFAPNYWAATAQMEGGSSDLYEGSWQQIEVPALVVTGSEDFNYFPAIRRNPALLTMAYDNMPMGDKYLVNIIGAEHQAFTDSEPWYPASPRDPRHHELIGRATTLFLDAFLKKNQDALQALRDGDLSRTFPGLIQQKNKTGSAAAVTMPVPVASVPDDTAWFQQLFSSLDSDANGSLQRSEIPSRMQRLLKGFDRIDRDADGVLSEREFVDQLSRYSNGVNGPGRRTANQAAATKAPLLEQGPYDAKAIDDVVLHDAERNRKLVMRITYPDAAGAFPLVLISHYSGGNRHAFNELTAFLTSHGYVCVTLDHADSSTGRSGSMKLEAIQQRTRDLGFILDSLAELASVQPLLSGRIDAHRIGTVGHYLGALMAELEAGVRWYPPAGGKPLSMTDTRVNAVVMISPTGIGQGLTEHSWDKLTIPAMTITGSGDSSKRTGKSAEWRTDGYRLSPAGDKYLVYIDGYRSEGDPSRPGTVTYNEAVGDASAAYVYIAVQKFLDAYLKQDVSAQNWLVSGKLSALSGNRVKISHR
jgi:predicted dienelactone hydrolase